MNDAERAAWEQVRDEAAGLSRAAVEVLRRGASQERRGLVNGALAATIDALDTVRRIRGAT